MNRNGPSKEVHQKMHLISEQDARTEILSVLNYTVKA